MLNDWIKSSSGQVKQPSTNPAKLGGEVAGCQLNFLKGFYVID